MSEYPLIGPHEGIEFELIDEGVKHVAFFHDIIPKKYHEYKTRPEFDAIEWVDHVAEHKFDIKYVVLFRRTHEEDAQELASIIQSGYSNYFEDGERIERAIGRILGYAKEAVDFYINRLRQRGRIR